MKLSSELVEAVLLLLFASGAVLILGDDLRWELRRIVYRRRLAAEKARSSVKVHGPGIWRELEKLLLEIPPEFRPSPEAFVAVLGLLWLFCTVAFVRQLGMAAFVCGGITAALPLVLLKLRFTASQAKMRSEGQALISLILANYQVCHGNVSEAVEQSAACRDEIPRTAEHLYMFLMRLRNSRSKEEIYQAGAVFGSSISAIWAELLAEYIIMGYLQGCDITASLRELDSQLTEEGGIIEEQRRLNSETVRMTVILIPLTIVMMVYMSVRQLGIPVSQLIENQFSDGIAALLFAGSAVLFVVNLAAAGYMKLGGGEWK